jgi:hypothetical protein
MTSKFIQGSIVFPNGVVKNTSIVPGANGQILAASSTSASGFEFVNAGSGPQGAVGPTGFQGPLGPQGITGPIGLQGPTGPDGLQGLVGSTGPQGPQGLIGATGSSGLQGATGPQGAIGATGATGVSGVVGNTGATGPVGATGPQGFQGSQGPNGQFGILVFADNAARDAAIPIGSRYAGQFTFQTSTNQLTYWRADTSAWIVYA